MEPLSKNKYSVYLVKTGLILLISTLLFGLAGAIEYAFPGFWRNIFSFEKIRPLHVSSAVFWILTGATGSVLYYLQEHNNEELKFKNGVKFLFYIFALTMAAILISYCFGVFGGREYWEFHPYFAIPLTIGWILFIVLYLSNFKTLKNQPVYIWMWFTGALFFLFTYLESNLWIIPYFRDNLIKDTTIQWKSYGSLVGSWNLLVYGTSIYLMDKISGNKKYSYSNMAFGLYFLGLFNLMFNWGHHIYTLPTQPYVKHIAYIVSMTELFIFGRIIYLWKSSLDTAKKFAHYNSYQFFLASDIWVFLTLGLAIIMSIPALNIYMHGTHVIVAHTMGATIGINTMLLLAFAIDITGTGHKNIKLFRQVCLISNIALFFFWISLIIAGFIKAYWQFNEPNVAYGAMIGRLKPWFHLFLLTGTLVVIGLTIIAVYLIRSNKQEVSRY